MVRGIESSSNGGVQRRSTVDNGDNGVTRAWGINHTVASTRRILCKLVRMSHHHALRMTPQVEGTSDMVGDVSRET
jgi:hypothetical protein